MHYITHFPHCKYIFPFSSEQIHPPERKNSHVCPVYFPGKTDILSPNTYRKEGKRMLDRIATILVIIGALNWGGVGLFRFDLVSWIFGGQDSLWARIIYTVVALAGVWCITLLFRPRVEEAYHE